MPENTTQHNFWKISPGENGHIWPLCWNQKIIAIGWPLAGDFTHIPREQKKERIQAVVDSNHDNRDYSFDKVKQVWQFANEIRIGDRVLANDGHSKVLGFGIVTGEIEPCRYVPSNPHYKHELSVDWYDWAPREVDENWNSTIIRLKPEKFEALEALPHSTAINYWKFSPFSACTDYALCQNQKCLALGYDGLGNILGFHRSEFDAARDDLHQQNSLFKRSDISAVWELTQLFPGDQVVITERDKQGPGQRKVLAYGRVTGTYYFDNNAARFKHRVPVEWVEVQNRYDSSNRVSTLKSIEEAEFEILTGAAPLSAFTSRSRVARSPAMPIPLPPFPRNQILYGPPGTGKTHHSIEMAVNIIEGPKDSREEYKRRFDELKDLGRIQFVTFHQSFSYEEFVEGLRPVLEDEGNDGQNGDEVQTDRQAEPQVRYKIQNGIFKTMALRASHAVATPQPFDSVWQQLGQRIQSGELTELDGRTSASRFKLIWTGTAIEGENLLSLKENRFFSTSEATQRLAWERLPSGLEVNGTPFVGLGREGKGHSAFAAVIHNQLTTLAGIRPDFESATRFVLIIDEINRGNISKILGELITLLEEDKRLGQDNELKLTLPISQHSFGVPPNLYVLGTMNTADKSLALLDIALRRRFSFVEMTPEPDRFPAFAREAMATLNLRLEAVLDREHRIGHAYFMGCQDERTFDKTFRIKIIPLLQEFFYNDWNTLRAVLGEAGDDGRFIRKMPSLPGLPTRNRWRWWYDGPGEKPLRDNEFPCLQILRSNYHRLKESLTSSSTAALESESYMG